MRYPLLWERLAPDGGAVSDWSWADERLARLRTLGIRPIVGLVHHGSGPRSTHLLDPGFADGLAGYAGQLAARYPWLADYTPVNEPLTTARFSALYGHWYPHRRDHASFVRALLNQCRATLLAMQAIRRVNPAARLVQTEDLGKTFGTRAMQAQAEFENQRRWLSFDLLAGRIDEAHPLWSYLLSNGATPAELHWFGEQAAPPDVLGINYYITSQRFIDARLARYPAYARTSNGGADYADVVAARTCGSGVGGIAGLLGEAWQRYGRPLAVTEVHLACSREEQMRWVLEIWREALAARHSGVDVRAVTLWSLLGSFDWDSLLTRDRGHYESGVFDVRGSAPRPTALAGLARALAAGEEPVHPVLSGTGWWRRPMRLEHPPVRPHRPDGLTAPVRSARPPRRAARPILITGVTGTLGHAFERICAVRGLATCGLRRSELDIADPAALRRAVEQIRPWAVVNAAGWVRIDDAEHDPAACFRVNTEAAQWLAALCAERQLPLVTFSTDQVFDGEADAPYDEDAPTAPLNVYGASKVAAERAVLAGCRAALVIRTSAFFGPWDEHNFVFHALRTLAAGGPFVAADDQTVSPTFVPDLVNTALDLLIDGEAGLWHLANQGAVSWADLARAAAVLAGLDAGRLIARPTRRSGVALRPAYSALSSRRACLLPRWEQALERYVAQRPPLARAS